MKTQTKNRRALLACLLASGLAMTSTGCSSSGMSLASMNPFSKSNSGLSTDSPSSPATALASATDGTKNVFKTVSTSTRNAMSKTGDAVAGVFRREKSTVNGEPIAEDDPLRLDGTPKKIDSDVYVASGQLWESTGNFPKALESYQRALQEDPKDAAALASIARLSFRQGKHQDAAQYFQKAVAIKPDDAGLYNDLGLTLSRLGQHELAVQSVQRALQLAPKTSRYVNNLASVQFESGNQQAAFGTLSAANEAAVAHFNMAFLYYRKGQLNEAKQQLNQAIAFDSKAAADPAIKKAVDRSKEMLAQIDSAAPATTPGITPQSPTMPTLPAASQPAARIAQGTKVETRSYTLPVSPGRAAGQTTPASANMPTTPTLPAAARLPGYAMPASSGTVTATPPAASTTPETPPTTPPATTPPPPATQPSGAFALPPGFGS